MKFMGKYWWMCDMPRSKQRLAQLSRVLRDMPQNAVPMTVSEFDGFVTGVLITPAYISSSEWLPHVWGEARGAQFPNEHIAKTTIDVLLEHFDVVASELSTMAAVQPIYGESETGELFFWEPWVDGFMQSVLLRPVEWQTFYKKADEDVQTTISFLQSLNDIRTGKSDLSAPQIKEIDHVAGDVIPSCVSLIANRSRPDRCFPHAANITTTPDCAASEPSCWDS